MDLKGTLISELGRLHCIKCNSGSRLISQFQFCVREFETPRYSVFGDWRNPKREKGMKKENQIIKNNENQF